MDCQTFKKERVIKNLDEAIEIENYLIAYSSKYNSLSLVERV